MATTYKAEQEKLRLAQLRSELAMNFEIPARDLMWNAAMDLGISLKALEKRLAKEREA